MSKYGKYIIGVLAGIILIIFVWQIAISQKDGKKSEISYSEELMEEIELRPDMDKNEYYSNDNAVLNINIKSNKDVKGLKILVEGMENRYGKNYFHEKKLVDLPKDVEQQIVIEKKIPECSSCSGFPEGEYSIVVDVLRDSYSLISKKVVFNLMP